MRWLPFLNICLALMILVAGGGIAFVLQNKPEIEPPHVIAPPHLKGWEGDRLSLNEGPLTLKWSPPQMLLPDLQNELEYFGVNKRPDSNGKSFHLRLHPSDQVISAKIGQPIYLRYKGRYSFSPNNASTPLWIAGNIIGNELAVTVDMRDNEGAPVLEPATCHHFSLTAKPLPQQKAWTLGRYRADSTLLVRQKARWLGPDRFLELHGGEEYAHTIGKQRIDFLEEEDSYACFLGPGDFLVWNGKRWISPEPGLDTGKYNLMTAKRVDDRVLALELWAPGGQAMLGLKLIRSQIQEQPIDSSQEFKFVGAKTWAQFIVECSNGKRMSVKPHDWLVLTDTGWSKINTPELVDDYVSGKLTGPMVILNELKRRNGKQVLAGHVFSKSRTTVEEFEIAGQSHTTLANFYPSIPELLDSEDP